MCDPVSLALASTAATVVGAGGSLVSSMGAASAAKKQQAEVLSWQRQQKKNRDASFERQEQLRQEADRSRVAGLEELDQESRAKRQAEEEARLATELTGEGTVGRDESGAPLAQSDITLAGQNTSTTPNSFRNDLAAAINTATSGARARMQALAGVQAYGNAGDQNKTILNKAGADIDMFNEFRRGELGVLAAQQAVDPVQVTYSPSPLADAFSTALQVGSQGLGNAFGPGGGFSNLKFGTGGATTVPTDAWSGLRHMTLPKTAPIPPMRVF